MENSLSNMMCLDIYLLSLDSKESNKIKKQVKALDVESKPLLSWNISHTNSFVMSRKELDIQKIKAFAEKYKWKNDIQKILSNNPFEALVLTDSLEKIIWVNKGFTEMTGYSKTFATNKYPSFLQGEMTSKESKKEIRTNLQKEKPFELSVINYKKDKTPYTCQVQIFPLYSNKITHYIALETQIQ
ncbi:PAS domain-containing protein [Bernardetia sp. ABR2-2B]|uniref:PAS domain-containing protein n=1 Tax=Bernardetia sp. ABR2-2B TaxID=3127472 RepID=UPI0030CD2053